MVMTMPVSSGRTEVGNACVVITKSGVCRWRSMARQESDSASLVYFCAACCSLQCAQTPVIVVTSSDAPKDHERVARIGISSYFRKPTDLEDFMKLGEVVKALG